MTATIYLTIAVLIEFGRRNCKSNKFFSLIILLFLNLFFSQQVFAQLVQYPTYEIENFPSEVHGGVRATWEITQDEQGVLYFANTGGILIYDGSVWRTIVLDERPVVRSVSRSDKNNILVGFSRHFGQLTFSKTGGYQFEKLGKMPKSSPKGIKQLSGNNRYLIPTFSYLNVYENGKIETISKKSKYERVNKIGNDIYLSKRGHGLFLYKDRELLPVGGTEYFKTKKQSVISVFKNQKGLILVTRQSGIFSLIQGKLSKFDIPNKLFNETTVFTGIELQDGRYAIGSTDGLFVFDQKIRLKNHIGTDTGLQDNFVRSLHEDYQGNIWLGLNDGISRVNFRYGVHSFDKKYAQLNSIVNYLEQFNGKLYVATSTGIRESEISHASLRQIFVPVASDELKAQTWSMVNFDNKRLFIGSRWGISALDIENNYEQILDSKSTGAIYTMIKSEVFKNHAYVGGSKGLGLLNLEKPDELTRFPKLPLKSVWEGLFEDTSSEEVWVRELFKGIYRIKFSDSKRNKDSYVFNKYTHADGLPSKSYRYMKFFKFNDEFVLGTMKGIYRFNRTKNKFQFDQRFSKLPNSKNKLLEALIQLPDNTKFAVFSEIRANKWSVSLYKFDSDFSFQKLYLDNEVLSKFSRIKLFAFGNRVFLTGTAGILLIPRDTQAISTRAKSLLRKISVNKVKIYDGGPESDIQGQIFAIKSTFGYSQNDFSFKISMPDYLNTDENKYRYKLDNFDKRFSEYTDSREVTYTNLPPKKYTLIIEGINSRGQELAPSNYSFEINPPWWQSTYFYVAEVLFFLVLLFFTVLVKQNTRVEKLATALTFVVIIIIFEYVNLILDPLILEISGGVPVFTLVSKVILGMMLQPTERITSRSLDWCSQKFSRNTVS
ncbi:MAG: triple tyrosine motif-containing protein [Nitrospinota bacterium]|nr:triple tyrosine motif-containing protein [Nitrospinota bacterium]